MNPQREVIIRRRAQRELDALGRGAANADVRRLQGIEPPRYRLRVGRYRVIFASDPGAIIVERVRDRRDVYR